MVKIFLIIIFVIHLLSSWVLLKFEYKLAIGVINAIIAGIAIDLFINNEWQNLWFVKLITILYSITFFFTLKESFMIKLIRIFILILGYKIILTS